MGIIAAVPAVASGLSKVIGSLSNLFGGKLIYGLKKEEFAQITSDLKWHRYAWMNGYRFTEILPAGMSMSEFHFQLFGVYASIYENPELVQVLPNFSYFDPNKSPVGYKYASNDSIDQQVFAYWKPTPTQMARILPTSEYYRVNAPYIESVIGKPTGSSILNAGFSGGSMPLLIFGALAAGLFFFTKR